MNINLFVTHLERDLADNCVLCNTCGDITGQLAGFCSCFQPVEICLISAPSKHFWGELNLEILGDFLASVSYIEIGTLGYLKHTVVTIVF